MPLFKYKAIDASGKFITGSLDAGNASDLELRLEKMDMDLVTYKQKEHGADLFGRNKITRIGGDSRTFVVKESEKIALTIREYLALPRPPVTSARKMNAGAISLAWLESVWRDCGLGGW